MISPFYTLLEASQRWATASGADPGAAAAYISSFFASLAINAATTVSEHGDAASNVYSELAHEAETPGYTGGLNAQAVRGLNEAGASLVCAVLLIQPLFPILSPNCFRHVQACSILSSNK
jgi:hypothetical protein